MVFFVKQKLNKILFVLLIAFCCGSITPAYAESGKWSFTAEADPMTDKSLVFASVVATSHPKYATEAYVGIQCHNHSSLQLYIHADKYVGFSEHALVGTFMSVAYRVDKHKMTFWSAPQVWNNREGFSIYEREQIETIAAQWQKGNQLHMRIWNYNGQTFDYAFSLTGSNSAITKVLKDCRI